MEKENNTPQGVMSADYSSDRQKKLHLNFRYKSRAYTTMQAFKKFQSFNTTPNIVDLGSADAATMVELHNLLHAKQSIGIEYAKELIDASVPLPENCKLIQGDVTKTQSDISQGSNHLVTALAVLEHLDKPVELFYRAKEYLIDDGLLIASCPSPFWDKISGKVKLHEDEYHTMEFNKNVFYSLATEAGLEPLEYCPFMFAATGFMPYLKIPVSPSIAWNFDQLIHSVRLLDFTFVNQLFIARKTAK